MILAGDIGGTSTRLGFFEVRQGRLHSIIEQVYPSRNHQGLGEIASLFVASHKLKVQQACFGIAGPVLNGRVNTPNLAWFVDAALLAKELGLPSASLINDLEANAYGIAALEPGDMLVLRAGASGATGNAAVISAGTGLGEAGLYWDGRYHQPFACEGGHTDFGPRNELESALLDFLRGRFGHVSYERVVSGPGLLNIFEFLRDTKRGEVSATLAEELKAADPSMVISRAGLEGRYKICIQALDLFVSLYGAEAGNLALKVMATGGVYVGGGIAPQILEKMKSPLFLESFLDKARMRPLMERLPIRVILNDKTALLGAARCAARKGGLL
jgi:glucokinase